MIQDDMLKELFEIVNKKYNADDLKQSLMEWLIKYYQREHFRQIETIKQISTFLPLLEHDIENARFLDDPMALSKYLPYIQDANKLLEERIKS